jgi:hypothetical protein
LIIYRSYKFVKKNHFFAKNLMVDTTLVVLIAAFVIAVIALIAYLLWRFYLRFIWYTPKVKKDEYVKYSFPSTMHMFGGSQGAPVTIHMWGQAMASSEFDGKTTIDWQRMCSEISGAKVIAKGDPHGDDWQEKICLTSDQQKNLAWDHMFFGDGKTPPAAWAGICLQVQSDDTANPNFQAAHTWASNEMGADNLTVVKGSIPNSGAICTSNNGNGGNGGNGKCPKCPVCPKCPQCPQCPQCPPALPLSDTCLGVIQGKKAFNIKRGAKPCVALNQAIHGAISEGSCPGRAGDPKDSAYSNVSHAPYNSIYLGGNCA